MWILCVGLYVVSLWSALSSAIEVNQASRDGRLAGARRPLMRFVSMQRRDGSTSTSGRQQYGREIVEISDPTTDSSLHQVADCGDSHACRDGAHDTTPQPTFRPYSQEELNGLLKKYVESNGGELAPHERPSNKLANLYMDETVNVLEGDKETGKSQEKSKSWLLMQAQANKNPYDDHGGWVTLEPVPWSSSQVQKWEPNKRPPEIPQWAEEQPTQSASSSWPRPTATTTTTTTAGKWPEKQPWSNKNSYTYKPSSALKPWSDKYHVKPAGWGGGGGGDGWGAGSDIITEDGPSQFPHQQPARPTWYERPQTEVVYQGGLEDAPHQSPTNYGQHHLGEADGRWVLLSSTKGYSVPHRSQARRRSMFVTGKAHAAQGDDTPTIKSHRTVRLTVLPPLNGTANTTTIHGGLVEVEQTSQTVDEAHREHLAKMMKLGPVKAAASAAPTTGGGGGKRLGSAIKVYPVHSPSAENQSRNNAMLAAVGAGMIPATVAMMLPMVFGKRRRRRSALQPPHMTTLQLHHLRAR